MISARALLLLALALPQTKPSGGAVAKFVPPVPTPASFISDERNVLTPAERQSLDARITAIQRDGAGDVAVAILPSIGEYTPGEVGVEIYRTWRVGSVAPIGSPRRDVGVLILIVPKELSPNNRGECWITTGTGAEGIITDATAGSICRNAMIPHLRNRKYAAAISSGLGLIENRLRTNAGLGLAPGVAAKANDTDEPSAAPAPTGVRGTVFTFAAGVGALLALLFGIGKWRRYHGRKCPRCGRQMRRLNETEDDAMLEFGARLEEKLKSVDYDVWICECGESKTIPYRRWFSSYTDCRECNRRTARQNYVVIAPATKHSTGIAEKRFRCQQCNAEWTETVVLPVIVESSSSSGGGGGGGGSSFGGSGSSSGGGGGSSY